MIVEEITDKLRKNLKEAVRRNFAPAILLSGGLDTSILAFCLTSISPGIKAIHVKLENYGGDFKYVQMISRFLGLEVYFKEIEVEEALSTIAEVIKVRQSFDPALPNDLAIYFALQLAQEKGIKEVITGDGSDELFAGYSFMFNLNLEDYLPNLVRTMSFSSNEIGTYLGIRIIQPYLDKEIIDFALSCPKDLKVREERGRKFGKWILRKSFEGLLPDEIIWQDKRPIEVGSGFSKLRQIIAKKISKAGSHVPIKPLSEDHLFYFQIYQEIIGEIPRAKEGESICPNCGAGLKLPFHCRICGWAKDMI